MNLSIKKKKMLIEVLKSKRYSKKSDNLSNVGKYLEL